MQLILTNDNDMSNNLYIPTNQTHTSKLNTILMDTIHAAHPD